MGRFDHNWSGVIAPWKMSPPGSPKRCFQIRWRQHLPGDHRTAEVGREAVDGGEYRIGGGIRMRVPVPVAGEVLAEQARDVAPRVARGNHLPSTG